MSELLSTIPGTIIGIGIVAAGIIAGFLYLTSVYSQQKRAIKDEGAKDEDRLIDILQKTVNELEKQVNQQTKDIEELSSEVSKLRTENKTLLEILQGRDKQTQLFYEEGFKAMKEASEILTIVKDVKETVTAKNESINKLIATVADNAKIILEAAKL